jgi:hypothetical protein
MQVVEALNNAGAFMGEQISVDRSADGKLVVNAMVETDQRKREIQTALAQFQGNAAVRINLETYAEAQERIARQQKSGSQPSQTGSIDATTGGQNVSPVYDDLRRRLSEEEAQRLSDSAMDRGRQARLHAVAAKQIAERFSTADLAKLSPAERARWLSLIRGHAEDFLKQTDAIRRGLGPIFPEAGSGGGGTAAAADTDAEIRARARELFAASLSLENGLTSSFAVSTGGGEAPVKTAAFWRQFANATALARSLANAK